MIQFFERFLIASLFVLLIVIKMELTLGKSSDTSGSKKGTTTNGTTTTATTTTTTTTTTTLKPIDQPKNSLLCSAKENQFERMKYRCLKNEEGIGCLPTKFCKIKNGTEIQQGQYPCVCESSKSLPNKGDKYECALPKEKKAGINGTTSVSRSVFGKSYVILMLSIAITALGVLTLCLQEV